MFNDLSRTRQLQLQMTGYRFTNARPNSATDTTCPRFTVNFDFSIFYNTFVHYMTLSHYI